MIEDVGVAERKISKNAGIVVGMLCGIRLHAGKGGTAAQLQKLPGHRFQFTGGHESALDASNPHRTCLLWFPGLSALCGRCTRSLFLAGRGRTAARLRLGEERAGEERQKSTDGNN